MDHETVRRNLAEVQQALNRNAAEREVLGSLLRGYEGWLRLNPEPAGASPQLPLLPLDLSRETRPKGSVSMRGAVLRVLREAHGEPLHAKEILRRATALGAVTAATNPLGTVDLIAYSLKKSGHPMRKAGPRTWAYYQDAEEDGAPM